MTRVFITGISGQDGSYLADRFVAESHEVHGLIRFWDDDARVLAERHPSVTMHEGDLADFDRITELVTTLRPDEVYNLGGISSVAQSWQLPAATGLVTGVAVANLLDATFKLDNGAHFLQASSSEIFGTPSDVPQTEGTSIKPGSPYGAAKAYAHQMVQLYRARGMHASNCIFYNHESPRRPEVFVTRKITAGAARIAAGVQTSIELGDLSVKRDWGWAPDYVDAMVLAVRHPEPDDYVIATGVAHSVADFAAAAFAAAGIADWEKYVTVNPEFIRPAEISQMLGDSSKARAQLGWAPKVSFDDLVARLVESDQAGLG